MGAVDQIVHLRVDKPEQAIPGGGVPPSPPEPPFGIDSRASVAPLAIPLSGGAIGSYQLEESFPSLTFPGCGISGRRAW